MTPLFMPSPESGRPALFVDRDGTVIRDVGYPNDPTRVELLPGAAAALRRLADAGWLLVQVSNQSGIARGLVTPAQYEAVQRRVEALLGEVGVRLDAAYYCPHHPDERPACDCRKPGTRLHRRAADALEIDLAGSACVGDKLGDVEPARALGSRGILVRSGEGARHQAAAAEAGFEVADDLAAAVSLLIGAG